MCAAGNRRGKTDGVIGGAACHGTRLFVSPTDSDAGRWKVAAEEFRTMTRTVLHDYTRIDVLEPRRKHQLRHRHRHRHVAKAAQPVGLNRSRHQPPRSAGRDRRSRRTRQRRSVVYLA
jgi:hypothetical protein